MSYTAKHAQELWCPLVRVGVMPQAGGPAGINDPTSSFRGNCIADQCAMWRWAEEPIVRRRVLTSIDGEETIEPDRPANIPNDWEFCAYDPADGEPSCWVEPEHIARQRRYGFCGLAGRPELP